MYKFIFWFCNLVIIAHSQTFSQTFTDLKNNFDLYLNYRNGLNKTVLFDKNRIIIKNNTTGIFSIYNDEISVLNMIFSSSNDKAISYFYKWKKQKHLSSFQIDSLNKIYFSKRVLSKNKSLLGKRIAIDPGHIASDTLEARVEQKYLDFYTFNKSKTKTRVFLYEALFTLQTAEVLKYLCEKKGAQVFLSRTEKNKTMFTHSYLQWFQNNKKQYLDSLYKVGMLNKSQFNKLQKMNVRLFFNQHFKHIELKNRINKINQFNPDATVIIHYNVDEKNYRWKKTTPKNFTMAFIPGCFTNNDLKYETHQIELIRLLLGNDLKQSELLSAFTVNQFNKELNIPIATVNDAIYLKKNAIITKSKGVYCRDLTLSLGIKSPLVYGEALYQDNINECYALMENDFECNGKKISKRIYLTALAYFNALEVYFRL